MTDQKRIEQRLLQRGWALRWVWRRSYDRVGFLPRLRYLLTHDSWGIDEGSYSRRIHRFGPLFVDMLYTRVELAARCIELSRMLHVHVDNEREMHDRALRAEAELRELKFANPMMRTASVRGGN